ncbi:hypothetical protein [Hydrogenimonas sp.]
MKVANLPKVLPEAELLVIGVTSPLLVGVYIDGSLVRSYEKDEKASKALPEVFHDVRYRYDLKAIYYAKGPGSFMAIKVTYVMAKTFCIALNIPLFGADAFLFNGNRPIKAIGQSCFVKKGGKITIERGGCPGEPAIFELPQRLVRKKFSTRSEPLYILPAV